MKKALKIFILIFLTSTIALITYIIDTDKDLKVEAQKILGESKKSLDSASLGLSNLDYSREFNLEETDKLKNIDIEIGTGAIKVIEGDGYRLTVKSSSEIAEDAYTNSGTGISVIPKGASAEVTLVIPGDSNISLKTKSSVADVRIEGIAEAEIENNIGDITLEDVTKVLSVTNGTGDIKIKKAETIDKISNNIGEVKVEVRKQKNSFDIKNNIGDVEVKINRDFDGSFRTKKTLGETHIYNMKGGNSFLGYIEINMGDIIVKGEEYE